MAVDKNGNTLLRGDLVRHDGIADVVEVAEPGTDTYIGLVTSSETLSPAQCALVLPADGRAFATSPPAAPAPTPTPAPAPPVPTETALLEDDFESGVFSTAWLAPHRSLFSIVPHPTDPLVVTNPRQGNCARVHYLLDSTMPPHHDDNKFLWWFPGSAHPRLRVRGSVLIPRNVELHGATRPIQRKLIYFKSNYIPDGREIPAIGYVLTSEGLTPGAEFITLRLGYGGGGGTGASLENIGRIYKGVWTDIEIETQLNTPSAVGEPNTNDGIFRLWLDGALAYENTTLDFRSYAGQTDGPGKSADYMLAQVEIGRQADRTRSDPVDEDRYWDNISVSA